MMKRLVGSCIFAAACLHAAGAFAGGSVSPAYVSQARGYVQTTISLQDIVKPVTKLMAATSQINAGDANWSLIAQNGSYNHAAVVQFGHHSVGFIAQTGFNNTAFLQQFNGHQQAFIIQQGAGNFVTVTQR